MPNDIADTPVEDVVVDEPEVVSQDEPQSDTPAQNNEVEKQRLESLERELSRLRSAQSAADKRAAESERRARELEESQRKSSFGDDDKAYWQSVAQEQARKAAELELKVEVNNLLSEHSNLPDVVREAIRRNPVGFIGDAPDVPTAIVRIGNYLSELEAKNPPQVTNEPAPKEFNVPQPTQRKSVPSTKPRTLDQAAAKLVESGLFN